MSTFHFISQILTMTHMLTFIFIFGILFYEISSQNQDEICNTLIRIKDGFWNCTKVSECSYAEHLLMTGRTKTCGYEKHVQKICCPQRRPTVAVTSKPILPKSPPVNKNPIEIIRKKCIEYGKYRYENETITSNVIGQKPYTQSTMKCINLDPLIVGGIPALPYEFPHMALLGYRDVPIKQIEWSCGGSLISEKYILTAAHCTSNAGYGPVKWAAMGLLNKKELYSAKLDKNIFRVEENIIHPHYESESHQHDIALLKLTTTVNLSPAIRPTCLFTSAEFPKILQNNATISGWGRTHASETESEKLLKANIFLVPTNECVALYGTNKNEGFDPQNMICAGDKFKGKDTCEGDSGGPLQVPISDYMCMWSLVGVTSFGSQYCGDKTPAAYTKVYSYLPWIQRIVWP